MITKIINYLIFQIGWFIIAILHNNTGAFIGFVFAMANYIMLHPSRNTIIGCALAVFVGIANDSLISYVGMIKYAETSAYMTWWMAAMWFLFVSTLPSSLAWIRKLPILWIAILGGIGGSSAYVAGGYFGAITYTGDAIPAYMFHFLNWAVLFPIITFLSVRIKD